VGAQQKASQGQFICVDLDLQLLAGTVQDPAFGCMSEDCGKSLTAPENTVSIFVAVERLVADAAQVA